MLELTNGGLCMSESVWFPPDIQPPLDEKVLVLTRWGRICDRTFRKYLRAEVPMFSPDALKLGTDVLWWAPIPEDGWHDFTVEKPPMETVVLTKDTYGAIYSDKWGFQLSFDREPRFDPACGKVCYWREIPTLPPGVELRRKK